MADRNGCGQRCTPMEAAGGQDVHAGDRTARGKKVMARNTGKPFGGLLLTADSAGFRDER
jgi:hypothetical protein